MNSHDKDMPKRFVIQQHSRGDDIHWDLMLEADDVLLTWRLNIPPAQITVHPTEATRIPDHPLRFLTYQGPVQNSDGNVKIADSGTYRRSDETANVIDLLFSGEILKGVHQLQQMRANYWLLKRTT